LLFDAKSSQYKIYKWCCIQNKVTARHDTMSIGGWFTVEKKGTKAALIDGQPLPLVRFVRQPLREACTDRSSPPFRYIIIFTLGDLQWFWTR
jgi:hypothetical protein